jgi:hypothetical protein
MLNIIYLYDIFMQYVPKPHYLAIECHLRGIAFPTQNSIFWRNAWSHIYVWLTLVSQRFFG